MWCGCLDGDLIWLSFADEKVVLIDSDAALMPCRLRPALLSRNSQDNRMSPSCKTTTWTPTWNTIEQSDNVLQC